MTFLAAEEVGAAGAAEESAATGAAEESAATGAKKGGRSIAGIPVPGFVPDITHLPDSPIGGGNKVIIAEFIACMVLIAITPLIGATVDTVTWMKRGFACTGLFLVLSLVASGGARASRIAAAFGGLVTLGLCITDRAVFAQIVALLGGGAATTEEEDVSEINDILGDDGE